MNAATIGLYGRLGFEHVIPLGFDHILFILSLYLLNSSVRSVLLQCTVFTLAHSLSLGVATIGNFAPDTQVVEPLIAFSIVLTALENILRPTLRAGRLVVIFGFGLVHGLGFASAIGEIGLPDSEFLTALASFNIGVELGQLTVVLGAYVMVTHWFGAKTWYRDRVVLPASSIIASIALYWTVERLIAGV